MRKGWYILVCLFATLCACTNDADDMYGMDGNVRSGEAEERIDLSATEVALDYFGRTVVVGAEGTGWWISGIELDGKMAYEPTQDEIDKLAETGSLKLACDWLTIMCRDNKIMISAKENGCEERTFKIHLQAGDNAGAITGHQLAAPLEGPLPNPLRLSTKDVTLDEYGRMVYVYTESKGWWIYGIEVDGKMVCQPTSTEMKRLAETGSFNVTCDWLTVMCRDNRIMISAKQNGYDERTFKIHLQSGDNVDAITGRQVNNPGEGWRPNPFHLSAKYVTLDADGSAVYVDAECKGWYIYGIEVDGKVVCQPTSTEMKKLAETGEFNVTCDWLTVMCRDNRIMMSADQNRDEERTFKILLQKGDNADAITGRQEAAF